jgi:hypothetical protein
MGAFLNTAARYTAVYLIGGIIARVADDTRKIRLKSVCERQLFRTVLGSYNNALSVCIRICGCFQEQHLILWLADDRI